MTKRSTSNRKSTTGRSRKSPARGRGTARPLITLSPDQSRELFALTLITIALITFIFFFTGSPESPNAAGILGTRWVGATQTLLGWGSLLVPLALGVLGGAILWQERREDQRLTGAMVLGTMFVLLAIEVLLEFAYGPRGEQLNFAGGEGGGTIGYYVSTTIARGIGAAATFVLFCALGLAGIVLTFNIKLRELVIGFRDGFARFATAVWPVGSGNPPAAPRAIPHVPAGSREHPFVPPPQPDEADLMTTPIAARQTRASLFNRPESKAGANPPPADQPAKNGSAKTKAKPAADAVLSGLLAAQLPEPAMVAPATPAAPTAEVVQQPLDGFEVDAVQRAWPMPAIEMLETYTGGTIGADEIQNKSRLIEETLSNFKVEVVVKNVNIGPAVMQFELQPAVGVKVSKVTSLERDLALALAAQSLRIEAPIPGKNYIGIEIPTSSTSTVGLRELVEAEEFEASKTRLRLPLGRDVSGRPVIAGMERMPHLLIAGSTGSGKSVAVNAFVCALLLKHTPDTLRFIMVDPKMVELVVYNHIPHLLSPVVTELERVVPTLKWATREMERRYKIFAKHGFRNIDSYRQAARRRADLEPMPYIVVIIDELADLMMMAPDEVETLICRLAQMARATGIHLVIATQRPSVDVVTGLIKANFPSRIAFAVTSQIDSRVILDMNGAEQLLGRGDMLFMASDAAKPVRIQGTFVSDSEVERLVLFWRNARPPEETEDAKPTTEAGRHEPRAATTGDAATSDRQPALQGPAEFLSADEQDALLPEAIRLVKQHKRASASLLQRRMRIGYSKAAQLIELLEQQGVVGPAEDGRSREVLQAEE